MQQNSTSKQSDEPPQTLEVISPEINSQASEQTPVVSVATPPIRHRFAELYILVSLFTTFVLGVLGPIALSIVWVYVGAIPVGMVGLINLIIIPILLLRKSLTGLYKGTGIVLLIVSVLAVASGVYFVLNVRSIEHTSDQYSKDLNAYYDQADAVARSDINVEQATKMLTSCNVIGFYYTHQDGTDGSENAEKSSTGILLYHIPKSFGNTITPSDNPGTTYRMHIADRMVATMVPIARSAQHSCNIQFWHDGSYEQYKDGSWYFMGQIVPGTQSATDKDSVIAWLQNCKVDYFVGYMADATIAKDANTKSWLQKAEHSPNGIAILENSPKTYIFASKQLTAELETTARAARQACYNQRKLSITIDDWTETEYPSGNWTRVKL